MTSLDHPFPTFPRIAMVAFDLDGTLADTESLSLPSAVKLMNDVYGVPVTVEYWYANLHGLAGQALLNAIEAQFGKRIELADFLARRVEQAPKIFENGVNPAPGMLQALRNLVAGGQLVCICSNSMPERIDLTLTNIVGQRSAGMNLTSMFEGHVYSAIGSNGLGKAKPAPDVYLTAAARYTVDPKKCVAVEDSPVGAAAAVAAGFTCLGFTGLTRHPERDARNLLDTGCTAVFSHWDEFIPLLGQLKI